MKNINEIGRLQNAQHLARGYANENWIIDTTAGRFFLKHRYPGLQSPKLIGAKHALIRHLRQSGFPVPEILATKSSDTLNESPLWQEALLGRKTAREFWYSIGPELGLKSHEEIDEFRRRLSL